MESAAARPDLDAMTVRAPLAYERFAEAVLDFSDAPTPLNLARYLAASRALTDPFAHKRELERSRPERRSAA